MTNLDHVAELGRRDKGLAIAATLRADGTIQSSLVNAGVMADPLTGEQVLAYVTYGKVKLANLRQRPQTATTFRAGRQWATVEGSAQIIGPDDPHPDVDSERLRLLLREVFTAAGGTHDNWAEYDRAIADQRRTIVLVRPTRIYGN